MKTICFKNLLDDFWKHKIIVSVLAIVFALSFGFQGYRKGIQSQNPSVQPVYEEKLKEYDSNIADAKNSLELVEKQINELQAYVDNSIYMKLDGQNLQLASAQYAVRSSDNVGNVLNSIILYINEGGLKSDVSTEYADLEPDYWREIISCSSSGNILNISVMHYEAETAKKILSIVCEKIQEQIPSIEAVQGNFTLEEINTSYYTKSDVNVINNQNNYRNNLKNYINNRIDQNNKVISQENSKSTYIEKNEAAYTTAAINPVVSAIKFALVGIVFAVVLPGIFFILRYLLGNRIHSARDVENIGLKVLSIFKTDKENPSVKRTALSIQCLAKLAGTSSLYLCAFQKDDKILQCLKEYTSALEKDDLQIFSGFNTMNNTDELETMLNCKNIVLYLRIGTTTYEELEQMIQTCNNCHISVLGCVAVE